MNIAPLAERILRRVSDQLYRTVNRATSLPVLITRSTSLMIEDKIGIQQVTGCLGKARQGKQGKSANGKAPHAKTFPHFSPDIGDTANTVSNQLYFSSAPLLLCPRTRRLATR